MTYKIDVNIVDDHKLMLDGLAKSLNENDTIHVSHTFSTLESCKNKLVERRPDVLLLDISMPDGSGIEFAQYILDVYPRVKVIAITSHDEYSVIHRMMEIGVHGYVLKSSSVEELVHAINAVYHDKQYLNPDVSAIINRASHDHVFITPTEQNILRLICQGLTNPQIADQLHMSQETANWYRKRLLVKFHVSNTASLVAFALREHLIDMP
ncbi:MAG: response regulator transcription factor [Bacteroidaceae bacterium]|nr:response regulator transcription factor [Bacteroidaceae bacterium]